MSALPPNKYYFIFSKGQRPGAEGTRARTEEGSAGEGGTRVKEESDDHEEGVEMGGTTVRAESDDREEGVEMGESEADEGQAVTGGVGNHYYGDEEMEA
ncbi:MAG: hypothetical protein Q9210_001354 [Variospora velana]